MTVYYWRKNPEEITEKCIKNVKYVNFFRDYVIIETKSGHTEEIDLNLISFIEEE